MNRTLATAKPNNRYVHHNNFRDVILKAIMTNSKVYFYETHTEDEDWVKQLTIERVKSLFPVNESIKSQPFLKKENLAFYAVLYKHRKRFSQQFEEMKNGDIPKFTRTRKFKRTK